MKHRLSTQSGLRRRAARLAVALCLPVSLMFSATGALADDGGHGHHAGAPKAIASGQGVVKKIDLKNQRLVLAHEPIKELGWPAMTMPLAVSSPDLLKNLQVGDRVEFDLKDGQTISAIRKKAGK